ncbi:MAG TPA: ComF family protein [Campylobacterales bacterium]|nr:ComF family protein [Campylobacterales bacterium]
MRCLICHKFSIESFCDTCQKKLLQPSISKRQIGSLAVYSFFKYQNIEDLLLTKHTPQGFIIYKALAKMTFKPFIKKFLKEDDRLVYVIGVDEIIKSGYSHVALLTHELRAKKSKILHAKLLSTNQVTYAGKSLEYRLKNPREFKYSGIKDIEAILVDDIITTGTTLKEAKKILEQEGVSILFSLTLADANR